VPYGLHLEPRSEASKEAAKKRRNDTGAELVGKCATGSDSLKAHAAPKGTGVALLKAFPCEIYTEGWRSTEIWCATEGYRAKECSDTSSAEG
jgi:hypothetical protein